MQEFPLCALISLRTSSIKQRPVYQEQRTLAQWHSLTRGHAHAAASRKSPQFRLIKRPLSVEDFLPSISSGLLDSPLALP